MTMHLCPFCGEPCRCESTVCSHACIQRHRSCEHCDLVMQADVALAERTRERDEALDVLAAFVREINDTFDCFDSDPVLVFGNPNRVSGTAMRLLARAGRLMIVIDSDGRGRVVGHWAKAHDGGKEKGE